MRIVSLLVPVFLAGCAPMPVRPTVGRPNVVLILSDDHRADHLSCAGHPVLRTPNLDALAAEGVRFTRAFVTAPVCASSRATVLTGRAEHAHGYTFGTPPLVPALRAETYPMLLRAAGYRTGFIGKLGIDAGQEFPSRAFDTWRPLSRHPYRKELSDGTRRHVTDMIGDAAVAFVRSRDPRPFCLSISFNAGHAEDHDHIDHYPWPAAEDALYVDGALPRPRLGTAADHARLPGFLRRSMGRERFGWRWDRPEKYDRNLRAYYRLLTGMDRNVGRVLQALEQTGQLDRTLVLFMGDNGYAMAERGLAGKWTHFDESLHVPLVVRGPGVGIGHTEDRLVLNSDLAPTVLEACGLPLPVGVTGRSLVRLLGRSEPPWREGFRCEHGFDPGTIPRWVGWRTQRWKYACYVDQRPPFEFLHDLVVDPDERQNLAARPEFSGVLRGLRARAFGAGPPLRSPNR